MVNRAQNSAVYSSMNFRQSEEQKFRVTEQDNEYLVTLENLGSSIVKKGIN